MKKFCLKFLYFFLNGKVITNCVNFLKRKAKLDKMKILMRADTHVSFSVPAEEPKAKCTFSQVTEFFISSKHYLLLIKVNFK